MESEFNPFSFKIEEREADCPKHGRQKCLARVYEGGKAVLEPCPLCQAEAEEDERKKAAARADAEARARWERSGVKPKFFPMTFSDYKAETEGQKKALAVCKAIASGESSRSAVLAGPNGTGKTMLASLAVKERGGFIYKMYEVVMMIKASYKASAREDEMDILARLSKAPLLAIDEVGKQFGSEAERNWLSYLIDERYEAGRPTALISNLKPMRQCSAEEKEQGLYIERYLGKDSVSRLAECADIVFVDGRDFRRGS